MFKHRYVHQLLKSTKPPMIHKVGSYIYIENKPTNVNKPKQGRSQFLVVVQPCKIHVHIYYHPNPPTSSPGKIFYFSYNRFIKFFLESIFFNMMIVKK